MKILGSHTQEQKKTQMMKTKLTILLMFGVTFIFAQVGIGTQTVGSSQILNINAAHKGILIPNVDIKDLASMAPIINPASSLMIYNTNATTGKGFYYWKSGNWTPLLNTTNIYKYLGIIRTETVSSTAGIIDDTPTSGVSYTIGEAPSAHDWNLLPGLSKTISIYSPNNSIGVTTSGIVQINSAVTEDTFMSFGIGLFIDNKLVQVRNFIISGKEYCLYNDFNIFFNLSNLAVGDRKVEIYGSLRVTTVGTQRINFGAKDSTCSNLNSSMDKSLMNIQISEL